MFLYGVRSYSSLLRENCSFHGKIKHGLNENFSFQQKLAAVCNKIKYINPRQLFIDISRSSLEIGEIFLSFSVQIKDSQADIIYVGLNIIY